MRPCFSEWPTCTVVTCLLLYCSVRVSQHACLAALLCVAVRRVGMHKQWSQGSQCRLAVHLHSAVSVLQDTDTGSINNNGILTIPHMIFICRDNIPDALEKGLEASSERTLLGTSELHTNAHADQRVACNTQQGCRRSLHLSSHWHLTWSGMIGWCLDGP